MIKKKEVTRVMFDNNGHVLLIAVNQIPALMATEYLVDEFKWKVHEVGIKQSQENYSYLTKVALEEIPDFADFDNDEDFGKAVWDICEQGTLKLIATRLKPEES